MSLSVAAVGGGLSAGMAGAAAPAQLTVALAKIGLAGFGVSKVSTALSSLLTAKGMELELPRLRDELGISATFSKPFSPTKIVRTVEELLAAV